MKRTYQKPTTKVVQIHHRQQLLSGSPYDNQKAPLETYDDQKSLNVYDTEGDDINDIKGIW